MAKFLFVFRGGGVAQTPPLSPSELQAHLKKWYEWRESLASRGHEPKGAPLENVGKTLRGRDRVVTDGPFVESKDMVTGNMEIGAISLDEAVALAEDCPIFEFDGSVEVRPMLEIASHDAR
jgi:hypothetical protein